jgi:uncharacterized protein (UPF0216 family)
MIPPKSPMSLLSSYKPKSTEELAEWLMMAARNLTDADGKRIYFRLEPSMAHQIASMMQEAKLKVPE